MTDTHPCVVSLGVQQGDGEGGSEVGGVEHVSEGQATFPQKPAHISTVVSTATDLERLFSLCSFANIF